MYVFTGRCSLLPVVNNSGAICNSWKLDPTTLRFPLRGMLPFDKVTHVHVLITLHWHVHVHTQAVIKCGFFHIKDLFEPQTGLLRYVLEQPYSREMVCNMLGLNKQVEQPLLLFLLLCPQLTSLFLSLSVSPFCRTFAIPLFHSPWFNLVPHLFRSSFVLFLIFFFCFCLSLPGSFLHISFKFLLSPHLPTLSFPQTFSSIVPW